MKFTMNAKELKAMMEKGLAAIDKKVTLDSLKKLYMQVEEDGTVKMWGTDMEHFAEIRTNNAFDTSPGVLGIDIDDIKIISKMNGDVTLEDVSTEMQQRINIKCGKKIVTIPRYANTDIFLPAMDDTEAHIITTTESWLLETIANLSLFVAGYDVNKMLNVFNFNTKRKRIEALGNHRIALRSLENQKIITETENPFDTVKLHVKCLPVFKKIMDKKSDAEVKVYQDQKYIRISGKDFTYVIRRIDGKYFNIEQMLCDSRDFVFNADREEMLKIMKYNADMVKEEKEPTIFHSENGKLYTYLQTSRYQTFDEIETENLVMDEDLFIGFNSHYLVDVLSVIDSENPVFRGSKRNAPMYIDGNEYNFLILPINIAGENYIINFRTQLDRAA
jgi:DNA polymerase III sliding clamp (beta) subunit (PCNA family)